MNSSSRRELRAYYEAEGAGDCQASLYQPGDWLHQRLKQVVLAQAEPLCRPGTVLLDAGCAEGLYLRHLGQHIGRSVGLDLSSAKLRRGLALAEGRPNLFFGQANLEELPLPTAAVDLALCIETIEHVPDHRRAVCELYRVLRPGGRAIISVPTERDELGGHYKLKLDWAEKSGHLHSFGRKEFTAWLAEGGWQVERQITIDVLGGRLRHAIVSSLPWRAGLVVWRIFRGPGFGGRVARRAGNYNDEPRYVTVGAWQRLDAWLTRLPGLRRWSSLAVWVCVKP